MKPTLRKGNYAELNIYFLSDFGGGLLGICNFPTSGDVLRNTTASKEGGCDVLADEIQGGSATNSNLRGNATPFSALIISIQIIKGQKSDELRETKFQTFECAHSQGFSQCSISAGVSISSSRRRLRSLNASLP